MRAARTDANHAKVRDGIRAALPGATVFDAARAGDGFPDLVVGYRRRNFLLEVKDEGKPPSSRKLTKKQTELHHAWQGQIAVVCNAAEAVAAILESYIETK